MTNRGETLAADGRSSAVEWNASADPPEAETLMAAGISSRLAPLLARRGITDPEAVEAFFHPSKETLHDPFLLSGMSAAVDLLSRCIEQKAKVAIVGDYDVDGVSGTALLVAVFRACGLETEAILPNRLSDGYGFQTTQVERAAESGCAAIVTVDCGTTAVEAVAAARAAGLEVIITDHHLPSPDLDNDAIQINPQQSDCSYPFRDLSGAGLAFKLGIALATRRGREVPLDALLRIACLGTIADMVPLVGENRVIAALGLRALEQSRSEGLKALIRTARVRPPFRADDVGFRMGPRLNAAGRLRRPDEALELLLTRDAHRAEALAQELEERNRERQTTERRIVHEARALFAEMDPLPGILVGWSEDWHRGVVGIAASRLAREFQRPTVLLAAEGSLATGSGRSIPGVHLHAFLDGWRKRMERFGGHSQAIGLTVEVEALPLLKSEWEAAALWPADLLVQRREYELELSAGDITRSLVDELDRFHPHGQGNPQPLIRVGPLRLEGEPRIFGKGHVQATARGADGSSVSVLAWNWQERMDLLRGEFEILAILQWDSYSNCPVLQIRACRACGDIVASSGNAE